MPKYLALLLTLLSLQIILSEAVSYDDDTILNKRQVKALNEVSEFMDLI